LVSVFDFAKGLASPMIPGPRGLAQQVVAYTPIPGVTAFAAHQLPKTTLRSHHTFSGWLLEQSPGQVFDAGTFSQARAVEQPLSHPHRNALRRGNSVGRGSNRI
jgi:hypothetical protein